MAHWLTTFLLVVSVVVGMDVGRGVTFTTSLDTSLQALVPLQKHGWLGSDCATSIGTANESVWIFGDTLVGSLYAGSDGKLRRNFTTMPRNSIGTLRKGDKSMSHFWRPEGDNQTGGFFNSTNQSDGQFMWPLVGSMVGQDMFLFAAEVRNTNTGLHFEIVATTLIVVKDALTTANPLEWRYEQLLLPWSSNLIAFSSAAVTHDGYLYVLGSVNSPGDLPTGVMMRAPVSSLLNCPLCFEFLSVSSTWIPSFTSASELQIVCDNVPSETTLTYMKPIGWFFLQIPYLETRIYLRRATSIVGPYSTDPIAIYDIPAPFNDTKKFFCYAPKVHEEFGNGTSFVFTYLCNSFDINDLIIYTNVYVPTFLRTVVGK